MASPAARVMFILSTVLLSTAVMANLSFEESIDLFTGKMYKEAKNQPKNKGKNFVMSALSADIVMDMVLYGAAGVTRNELLLALDINDLKTTTPQITKTIDMLNNSTGVKLNLANKAYFNKVINGKVELVAPSYNEIIKCVFRSKVELLDFAQNVKAANTINAWVASQTNNLIKNLISPASLSPDTSVVLVNAIYFLGKWLNKFDLEDTMKEEFTLVDGSKVLVDMMNQQNKFNYCEVSELDAKIVEMPYIGGETSMVIILPNTIDGISKVEDKLSENGLNKYLKNLYETKINIKLPKFTIQTDIDVKSCFQNLGAKKVFTPDAELPNILLNVKSGLYVSEAFQKAYIKVEESGAEAAAATVVIVGRSLALAPTPIIEFYADHPFVFVIKRGDIILFSGAYKGLMP